jgi:hypothetical protein
MRNFSTSGSDSGVVAATAAGFVDGTFLSFISFTTSILITPSDTPYFPSFSTLPIQFG